jgi:hypothetical protein
MKMAFCLPKDMTAKFLAAIKDGTIKPDDLIAMSSADRRSFLAQIVGDENAKDVNALLESKLLLKDQERGLVTWAKQVAGLSEPIKRDLVSRIEKLDRVLNPDEERAFLADYASQKIGATTTFEEAKRISEQSKNVIALKEAIPENSPIGSAERLAYGLALDEHHQYLNHLMGKDQLSLKEIAMHPSKWFGTVAGATKGILASFDNSFFGRQGLKMLFTNPDIWSKAFVKSWGDIGKEIAGVDAMRMIKADVLSRPNAINGKYKAGGYDLGVDFEEAFPSHLPERIPALGRLYKASESAFNGGALRMRADYADRIIKLAEQNGIDASNPAEAAGLGLLVNAMTGRGDIGRLKAIGNEINAAFFSIRFLKSNFDTLTMHRLGFSIKDAGTRAFVRKVAAQNLAKIAGGVAAILTTANFLHPGSVDFDPRSSKFGKITIGNTTFDVTGGMAPIVTLVSRIVPTLHDGQWGLWSKSPTTGNFVDLVAGKYGQQTAMDIVNSFWEGRLSPIAGAIRDAWKGQNYQGQAVTPLNTLANLFTPLPVQTAFQAQNESDVGARIATIILDGLGINANPPNALNVGFPNGDNTQRELIRLGFQPGDFQPATGNAKADELISSHLQPLVDKYAPTLVESKGFRQAPDALRTAWFNAMLKTWKNVAQAQAKMDDPVLFAKLKLEAIPYRSQKAIEAVTGQKPVEMLRPPPPAQGAPAP